MQISKSTTELLASLRLLSQGRLTRENDLGVLIELSGMNKQHDVLDNLSFHAKFASKTMGIMTRVGKDAKGYDTLSREFTEAIKKTRILLQILLQYAPEEIRYEFLSTYAGLTPDAFKHLLALCYDLSWYKNWRIDHPDRNLHNSE